MSQMNVSVQHILASVIASLQTEVLPHLEAQAKPASNVRACLMMLAHIEQRVGLEAKFLFDDNKALRLLLNEAVKNDKLTLDAAVRGNVASVLKQYPDRADFYDVADATNENRQYQELLTQVIRQLAGKADESFRPKLHQYLGELKQRDIKLSENASKLVPV